MYVKMFIRVPCLVDRIRCLHLMVPKCFVGNVPYGYNSYTTHENHFIYSDPIFISVDTYYHNVLDNLRPVQ